MKNSEKHQLILSLFLFSLAILTHIDNIVFKNGHCLEKCLFIEWTLRSK